MRYWIHSAHPVEYLIHQIPVVEKLGRIVQETQPLSFSLKYNAASKRFCFSVEFCRQQSNVYLYLPTVYWCYVYAWREIAYVNSVLMDLHYLNSVGFQSNSMDAKLPFLENIPINFCFQQLRIVNHDNFELLFMKPDIEREDLFWKQTLHNESRFY